MFVMMKRKIKTVMETNLVTNEQPTKGHSQFVFQSRGMKGLNTSTIQENFNNHFGKVNNNNNNNRIKERGKFRQDVLVTEQP